MGEAFFLIQIAYLTVCCCISKNLDCRMLALKCQIPHSEKHILNQTSQRFLREADNPLRSSAEEKQDVRENILTYSLEPEHGLSLF